MNKKVEIYSKSNCSYCVMAMNFFDSKGMAYEVYSADDPNIFDEMLKRNPQEEPYTSMYLRGTYARTYAQTFPSVLLSGFSLSMCLKEEE